MERWDNYALQVQQAKRYFLKYDQQALIRKCSLKWDETYMYLSLFGVLYRLNRENGDLERREGEAWKDGNSHAEVMTVLDLLCDSREDRCAAGRWRSMESFGLMFHQNLLQKKRDPQAEWIDREPEKFRRACESLGGRPEPGADIGYSLPVFEDLRICLRFWHGDEEFYPQLRYFWDENARMYLKYETMFFAVGLLLQHLKNAP